LFDADERDDEPGDRQQGGDELQPRAEGASGHTAGPWAAGKHNYRVSQRSGAVIGRSDQLVGMSGPDEPGHIGSGAPAVTCLLTVAVCRAAWSDFASSCPVRVVTERD
jgi:hypothetical protein